MVDILNELLTSLNVFFGLFSRITGFFVTIPIFSTNNIPAYAKIGFSLLLSFIIFPIMNNSTVISDSIIELMLFVSKEFMTGIILGFVCYLFFSVVYLAGHIIDMELGFSMASVINPEDETEIPLMANLFYMISALIFFSINGHHLFIKGLIHSFELLPLGALNFNNYMLDVIINIIGNTFVIAFKMGGPVLVSIFISNILMGILARTMPQMNVFVVGMPLKILVGLLILVIVIPLYGGVFEFIFDRMFESLDEFIMTITKG